MILPSLLRLGPDDRGPHQPQGTEAASSVLPSFPATDARNHMAFPNPEQRSAIVAILSRTSVLPFVIFGPPGTGKTSTMVQAIVEVSVVWGYTKALPRVIEAQMGRA